MNELTGGRRCSTVADVERQIVARDREIGQPVHQGPAGHGHPRRPRATAATG